MKVIRAEKKTFFRKFGIKIGAAVIALALIILVWGIELFSPPADEAISPDLYASAPLQETTEPKISVRETQLQQVAKAAALQDTSDVFVPYIPEQELSGKLSTPYIVLYDATHERILYKKNAEQLCYPASTTKILTACVAASICAPDTVFTVGDEVSLVAYDSSLAYLQKGQQMTFEMLLDAVMLPSGNDAAYVMAAGAGRLYAGDETLSAEAAVAVFCDLMNVTAKRIGALDSHFANPDGYHDDDHYTTAMDMMKIALYASSFDIVRNAYAKSETERTLLTGENFYWENSNPLIHTTSSYYYPYANGIKTGFTDQAGSCLVGSAEKDGVEIIAVTMNSPSIATRNSDLITMFDTAFTYCIPSETHS